MKNYFTPINIDIEHALIGEILLYKDAALYAFNTLEPKYFEDSMCSAIFDVMKTRFNNTQLYNDPLSVCADMGMEGREAKEFLLNCKKLVVSDESYKEHIRLIKRSYCDRELVTLSDDARNFAYCNHTISEMQTFLSEKLNLFDDSDQRETVGAEQGFQNFINSLDTKREYIETGVKPIDATLKISKGDYVIIGARPSVGKTALALQFAWEMSLNHKVVFFSFETSSNKIYDRIISRHCRASFSEITNNTLDDDTKAKIRAEKEKVKNRQFKVIEASGMTVTEIQAVAVKEKADVIFIDYLGLISLNTDQILSSYETTTRISKDLHTMAQRRKIAIIALSQLNREGNESPSLTSLRDSGQIEQDADAVILMGKIKDLEHPEIETLREIKIAKNKEGNLLSVQMYLNGAHQEFCKCDNIHKV